MYIVVTGSKQSNNILIYPYASILHFEFIEDTTANPS